MPGPELEEYRSAIFGFVERLLTAYIHDLESRPGPSDQKEFNDPVWQTIVIQPLEVAILDSPLLQRLRMIRQLGVAHWVYPGATHTRFEHTLGVVHQVQNLISAINKRSVEREQRAVITSPVENLMRLIALCHDIGHGVMSHVSENAIKNFRQSEPIFDQFGDDLGMERTKPSELAAYYMVESPAFGELLKVAKEKNRQHQLPDDAISSIKKAIVGQLIEDKIPLLHEFINGPFDADKLDYMPRDARMAGVPVVTDIPRLIQKVRATEVTQDKLPKRVAEKVKEGLTSYVITGIALSGGRTLDELMLGRTLLFDKIYRHQKVRAAEAMVAALLDKLGQIVPGSPAMLPYKLVDDQLINIDMSAIKSLAGRMPTGKKKEYSLIVLDLARRLRERRLFVRAFAFSRHMPLDPYGGYPRQAAGLDKLIRETSDSQSRGELAGRIADRVRVILQTLEQADLLEAFNGESLRSYIWIDPPDASSRGGDIVNAQLIAPSGELLPFKEETAEARAWTDAYLLARDLGYIFTAAELSPYVYLAAELEVRANYDVSMPSSMVSYTKQSEDLIDQLRRSLAAKGYYADAPFDIQPVPLRLSRADVRNKLDELASRLKGYVGPYREDLEDYSEEGGAVSRDRIRDWLRQFSDDGLIGSALEVLEEVRLIGRKEIGMSMVRFLEANDDFRDAFVCPLGEPKDSSAICTYQAADVQERYGFQVVPLAYALASMESRPILFVDDFLGSGKQSVTILESMLGEKTSFDLGEVRHPLSEPLRIALRERRLGFLFAAGMSEGWELLTNRADDLNLSAKIDVMIKEDELPVAFRGRLSTSKSRLREKCLEIGRELLRHQNPHRDPDWVTNKALGYGNRGFLVVFPYNTPSQTLTCLWSEGSIGSRQWSPLFPRRKKK